MKIKKYLFLLVLFLAFVLVGCGDEKNPSIAFDTIDFALEIGDEKTVNAKLTDLEGEVVLSSSDESVITIENGVVKALKEGTATIKAECGEYSATVTVTVLPAAVETFTVKFLDSDYSTLKVETVEKGKAATAPEMTSTESKQFKGWDKDFSNVQSNLNVIAQYSLQYTITYDVAGGALDEEGAANYVEGNVVNLPNAHKGGCKFLGWEDSNNPGDLIDKISNDTKGDLMLTAKYAQITKFNVEYDFDGGISSEVYLASKDSAVATWTIDNYNAVFGSYWGGGYSNYSYITNKSNDPGATFSDRFYIGVDKETGLYKVISILLSGASSWPSDAQYVITFSSSYKNHYAFHQQAVKVNVGDFVVFDGDFTKMKDIKSVNVYFFNSDPTVSVINKVINSSTDSLDKPTRLGYKFVGWKDSYGVSIPTVNDLYNNIKLVAQWEERTPVTAISTNEVVTEMVTGDTFKIVAKVVPSDAYFQQISFASSNSDIIAVDSSGKLTAKAIGEATITMTDYMKKVTNTKTIKVYAIDSIDLNLGAFSGVMKVNDTVQLNPVGFGKDGASRKFTFESLTPSVISVSSTGLVTALAAGNGTIKIKDDASTVHTLEVGVTVASFESSSDRVDALLELIASNNLSTVQCGNVSLYDDGTEKYYKATYSSVNYILFEDYVVNRTNANNVENPGGSPMARRTDASHDDSIQYVTVHDTATLTGNANSTAASMRTSGTSGSATIHYVTGSGGIYQSVTEDFIAWHAGDGTGNKIEYYDTGVAAPTSGDIYPAWDVKKTENGYIYTINGQDTRISVPSTGGTPKLAHLGPIWKIVNGNYWIGKTWYSSGYGYVGSFGGNNNSIGIEMCVNIGGDIYDTWQRTSQLVADILVRNNLDITRVKMHNTWTGKNCPQCLIAGHYWWNFIKMVEANYTIMKDFSDAKIEVVSNNKSIVSDNGRVINPPSITTKVSYTVSVTIGGVTKSITLYNVIPGTTTWERWDGSYPSSKIWNDGYFSKNDLSTRPYIG